MSTYSSRFIYELKLFLRSASWQNPPGRLPLAGGVHVKTKKGCLFLSRVDKQKNKEKIPSDPHCEQHSEGPAPHSKIDEIV